MCPAQARSHGSAASRQLRSVWPPGRIPGSPRTPGCPAFSGTLASAPSCLVVWRVPLKGQSLKRRRAPFTTLCSGLRWERRLSAGALAQLWPFRSLRSLPPAGMVPAQQERPRSLRNLLSGSPSLGAVQRVLSVRPHAVPNGLPRELVKNSTQGFLSGISSPNAACLSCFTRAVQGYLILPGLETDLGVCKLALCP